MLHSWCTKLFAITRPTAASLCRCWATWPTAKQPSMVRTNAGQQQLGWAGIKEAGIPCACPLLRVPCDCPSLACTSAADNPYVIDFWSNSNSFWPTTEETTNVARAANLMVLIHMVPA